MVHTVPVPSPVHDVRQSLLTQACLVDVTPFQPADVGEQGLSQQGGQCGWGTLQSFINLHLQYSPTPQKYVDC